MTKHACQQRDALVGQAGSNPIRDLGLRRVMSRDSSPTLAIPPEKYLSVDKYREVARLLRELKKESPERFKAAVLLANRIALPTIADRKKMFKPRWFGRLIGNEEVMAFEVAKL